MKWFKNLFNIIFVFVLLTLPVKAEILDVWSGDMYVVTESVIVSWDNPQDDRITHYEVQVLWLDQTPPMPIGIGTTTNTQMLIEKPRTGHFSLRIRSANDTETSDWATSINAGDTIDGTPFRLYFVVSPIEGGIEIK